MRIALTAAVLIWLAAGSFQPSWAASDGVELEIDAPSEPRRVSRELGFTVRIRNAGDRTARLFHPGERLDGWGNWKLEILVVAPDGQSTLLEPEVRFASVATPGESHFVSLAGGRSIELRFAFGPEGAVGGQAPWGARVPVTEELAELEPDELRRRLGIKGRIVYVHGRGTSLFLPDVLGNVFDLPGSYRIQVRYSNRVAKVLAVDASGERMELREIDGAWTGDLTCEFEIELTE